MTFLALLFITLAWNAPVDANGNTLSVDQYTLYAGTTSGVYIAAFPILDGKQTQQRFLINHPFTYFVLTDTINGIESAPSNEVSYQSSQP